MSCSTMLDRMLEADLHELDGTADSVLARHVRDCARCRTVASQLVSDTRSLAYVSLSTLTTRSTPVARKCRTNPEPMNPAPPVTTIRNVLLRRGERRLYANGAVRSMRERKLPVIVDASAHYEKAR